MYVVVETLRLSKTAKDKKRKGTKDKVSENSSTWKMRGEINEVEDLEDKRESCKERLVTRVNGEWSNEVTEV